MLKVPSPSSSTAKLAAAPSVTPSAPTNAFGHPCGTHTAGGGLMSSTTQAPLWHTCSWHCGFVGGGLALSQVPPSLKFVTGHVQSAAHSFCWHSALLTGVPKVQAVPTLLESATLLQTPL